MSSRNINFDVNESKYLKYKNKYLAFKKMKGGIDNDDFMHHEMQPSIDLSTAPPRRHRRHRQFSDSASNIEIDNKKLSPDRLSKEDTIIESKESVLSLIKTLFEMNNIDYYYEEFISTSKIEFIDTKLQNLDLHYCHLRVFPEDFCCLKVIEDLDLGWNFLEELPKDFHKIIVGGNLYLDHNRLSELPKNFEKICVGGDLRLDSNIFLNFHDNLKNIKINEIKTLTFGHKPCYMKVIDYNNMCLHIMKKNVCNVIIDTNDSDNEIRVYKNIIKVVRIQNTAAVSYLIWELFDIHSITQHYNTFMSNKDLDGEPRNNISFDKDGKLNYLDLSFYKLRTLPDNFSYLNVLGDLYLNYNCITELPSDFWKIKVNGSLYLDHNKLSKLPKYFHAIRVLNNITIHKNIISELPQLIASKDSKVPLWKTLTLGSNSNIIDDENKDRYKRTSEMCLNKNCTVYTNEPTNPDFEDYYKKQGSC